jgi:hypothetical protein
VPVLAVLAVTALVLTPIVLIAKGIF